MVAFCSARWTEARMRQLFAGADERAATLFLWHLAEEVEHKGVAHDVLDAHPDARPKLPFALLVAFVVLMGFTALGGVALFVRTRAALHPIRWCRLIGWGFSMGFTIMPVLAGSLGSSFHPEQLVDPPWLGQWLREYDPTDATLPYWTDAGLGSASTTSLAVDPKPVEGKLERHAA